jgi:uncharacterized membrane protein YqjE
MASGDRSLADVLHDIVRNVQEIVRSEVRLAKTELREEAAKAKAPTILLGAGGVATIFAVFFLLLSTVYALARVMPSWAAALIVAAGLVVVASMLLTAGMKGFKHVHPTPARTVETIQENVKWAKQHTK